MEEWAAPQWERQPGEPADWFNHFTMFLLGGPSRSLLGTYNIHRQKVGKGRTRQIPNSWVQKSREWGWRERAAAWDERNRLEAVAKEQAARDQMIQQHIAAARLMFGQSVKWFTQQPVLDPVTRQPQVGPDGKPVMALWTPTNFNDAMRAIQAGVELERKSRGMPAWVLEIDSMTNDQLIRAFQATVGAILGYRESDDEVFAPDPPPTSIDDTARQR